MQSGNAASLRRQKGAYILENTDGNGGFAAIIHIWLY